MRPPHSSELWAWIKVSLFTNVRLAGGASLESPRGALPSMPVSPIPQEGLPYFLSSVGIFLVPSPTDTVSCLPLCEMGSWCCVPITSSPGLSPPLPKGEAGKAHWSDWLRCHLSTSSIHLILAAPVPARGHAAGMCARWGEPGARQKTVPGAVSVAATDSESGVHLRSAAANEKEPRGVL